MVFQEHPTGWMNSELFVEVIKHFIKCTKSSKQNPTLFIYDNHESHLSIEVLDIAKDNGVTILTIPPHCSSRLQPLDVAVYGPLKCYYNKSIANWMMNNAGKTITIYNIAHCVKEAHTKALTPINIHSGFRKTEIYPFNPEIFSEDDFLKSAVIDRTEVSIENSNLEIPDNNLSQENVQSKKT